jgi:mannitol/fructose-specific phosphotransferase system IIA component (Ntr-type)
VDKFDRKIKSAPVIFHDETLGLLDMFHLLSEEFAQMEGISSDVIEGLLRSRENDYSTALSEFVAVPHFRLDGKDKFYMVLLRCRGGISFTSSYSSIKAIFAFASSRDQRKLHLWALSSIVQIISSNGFENRWLEAESPEEIRKIILNVKRRRTKKSGL